MSLWLSRKNRRLLTSAPAVW